VAVSNASRARAVVVRPRTSLHVAGLLSFAFVTIVLFGALYWLAAKNNTVEAIGVAHAVFIAICAFIYVRYRRLSFIIHDDYIIERHLFRLHSRIDIADVAKVVRARTYRPQSIETVKQLLALDQDGQRLFRMRGQFWTTDAIDTVMRASRAPVVFLEIPMSQTEFFEEFPTAPYWFQRRPSVIAGSLLCVLAGIAIAVGLMNVVGSPHA